MSLAGPARRRWAALSLVDVLDNTTHARIEGDAKVKTGSTGKLSITADEDVLRVAIAQSGGKTDDGGDFAFAGSRLGLRQRSDVQAGIVADANAGPDHHGRRCVDHYRQYRRHAGWCCRLAYHGRRRLQQHGPVSAGRRY